MTMRTDVTSNKRHETEMIWTQNYQTLKDIWLKLQYIFKYIYYIFLLYDTMDIFKTHCGYNQF